MFWSTAGSYLAILGSAGQVHHSDAQGETCTIFGDGEQSRDFTYIDNVVNANLLACEAGKANVSGRVFNVATGTTFL